MQKSLFLGQEKYAFDDLGYFSSARNIKFIYNIIFSIQ